MRKSLLLLTLLFALAACRKEPDMSGPDGRYFTYTNHDGTADFSAYGTYFIPDSIPVIGSGDQPQYAMGRAARHIVSLFASQMDTAATAVSPKSSSPTWAFMSATSNTRVISSITPVPYGGGDTPNIGCPPIGKIGDTGDMPTP